VFTARYALSPHIKQIRFFFKGLIVPSGQHSRGQVISTEIVTLLSMSTDINRFGFGEIPVDSGALYFSSPFSRLKYLCNLFRGSVVPPCPPGNFSDISVWSVICSVLGRRVSSLIDRFEKHLLSYL
jgi:hypothetical protein